MSYWGSILLTAFLLGIASAVWATRQFFSSPLKNGPWFYDPLIGSTAANPYLRATIARVGLLALNQFEALYLIAQQDSEGNPLRGDASYRIEGQILPARWWSITAYGPDCFLIPNNLDRYSYNVSNLQWNPDGSYVIYVSPQPKEGNWIPVDRVKNFDLTLRLYNPAPFILESFSSLLLPQIIREG